MVSGDTEEFRASFIYAFRKGKWH
jgi:hypothetical protein